MKTTRMRILDYLDKKGVSSSAELSRALKTTPANMRHHLSILLEEGAIEVIAQRPVKGRGRPAFLYSLTSLAQSHNLDRLASALLEEFLSKPEADIEDGRLERIAQRLAGEVGSTRSNLTNRLYAAVQRLNELHYQARWEAHAYTPHIILGHCPYAAILEDHPELCKMDADLISTIVKNQVYQAQRLVQTSSGTRQCVFLFSRSLAGAHRQAL